jgi:hypothetical protein
MFLFLQVSQLSAHAQGSGGPECRSQGEGASFTAARGAVEFDILYR